MRLIFVHGAPAVGKLTVGKQITRLTSARLFDNHAAIDLARTVFEFGAPGFWQLVEAVRIAALESAAQAEMPLLVMTSCYSEPDDRRAFEKYETVLIENGAEILPVFLYCSLDEMCRRVGNEDRKTRRKISTRSGLQSFLSKYNPVPVPRARCLKVNTETRSATETAADIVEQFGLMQQ